jgi:GlpG protein
MMWLIGCLIATHLGIWAVGNAAHVAGLFFGVLVGHLAWKRRRLFALAGLLLLILASLVPLAWAPWSVTWLSIKAYDAHLAGDHHRALEWYNRILRRDPENAWAYINRSGVYEALGDKKLAEEDRAMAIKLNPDYGRMN